MSSRLLTLLALSLVALPAFSQASLEALIDDIEPSVIEWRRDFHANPELSNREFRTAAVVADHLHSLGLEVETEVAHTGVIGILRGAHPGPMVAMREDLHGSIKFIFQPAEEGPPPGEEGGAELMVKEGVMEDVDAVFGLHINAGTYIGQINYRPQGIMAAVDDFRIVLNGKQAHGSAPWLGIDPIVTAAQVVNNLQTIVSRNLQLTKAAAVVTVGSIHGGVRSNIIPEELEMLGTIRTFDPEMRETLHKRFREIVGHTAASNGATAEIQLPYSAHYPVTYNDPDLTASMLPTLERIAGAENINLIDAVTGAEDFSYFAREVPGLYVFVGGKPLDVPADESVSHHTPDFFIDESGMKLGLQAYVNLALDYMEMASRQ